MRLAKDSQGLEFMYVLHLFFLDERQGLGFIRPTKPYRKALQQRVGV